MDELVTVNIGKNGISEKVVSELKSLIVKQGKVRVKFLKASRVDSDRRALAEDVAGKTGGKVVFARGNVVVLERKR